MADRDEANRTDSSVGGVADMLARTALERINSGQQARAPKSNRELAEPTDDKNDVISPDGGNDDDDLSDDMSEGGDDDQYSSDNDVIPDGDDDDTGTDPNDEGESDDKEEPGGDEQEGDDELLELAYDDDDVVEVTVDGEVQEVSLRDLKAAYSGEGAISKRLKEATEARKEATALKEQVLNDNEQARTRLLQTVQAFDELIFAPMVPKPNANLRQTNMAAYLDQKDAYEEDQKRIETSRQQMRQFIQQQTQEQADVRKNYRQEQQRILAEKAGLHDQKSAQAFRDDVQFAAQHYGFTPEAVAQVDNHAVFLMARDAVKYIRMTQMKDAARNSPNRGKAPTKTRRKLKPGGPTSKKVDAVRAAKQRQEATNRAKQSGKVDDVADMLVSSARTRKRRS